MRYAAILASFGAPEAPRDETGAQPRRRGPYDPAHPPDDRVPEHLRPPCSHDLHPRPVTVRRVPRVLVAGPGARSRSSSSKWLYLPDEPRQMLLLWEGDDDACAYIERAFGGFGDARHRDRHRRHARARGRVRAGSRRVRPAHGGDGIVAGRHRTPRSTSGAAAWKPRARTTRPRPGGHGPPSRPRVEEGTECPSSTTRSPPTTSARASR